jgi:hypothetical protein
MHEYLLFRKLDRKLADCSLEGAEGVMVMVVGGNQERKKVTPITGSRIAVVVSVVLEALWEAGFRKCCA